MNRKVLSASMHETCHIGALGNISKSLNQQTLPGIRMHMVPAGVELNHKGVCLVVPYVNFKVIEVEPVLDEERPMARQMARPPRHQSEQGVNSVNVSGPVDQAEETEPPPSGLAAIKNQTPGGRK
jgi:hypothetical protein